MGVLDFFRICGQLKRTARSGWVQNGISNVESVSDHSWRAAVLSLLIKDESVNKLHCMKMALVHDLAESMVGDITPKDGVSDEEKHQREADAMVKIETTLGDNPAGKEIRALWLEYEAQATPEAKLVRDFDKIEMIIQADEYERLGKAANLDAFFKSTEGKFQHPEVQAWDQELREDRQQRQQSTQQQ